jgi:type VI secretion system secreted protein VgrG
MEEEGIFYFFRHTASGHKLVIADDAVSYQDIPGDSTLTYDEVAGATRDELRVTGWMKTQELGSGKNTLQDYNYGKPMLDMMVSQPVMDSVQVGKVTHKLKVGGNDQFEVYDYPGNYGIRYQDLGDKSTGTGLAKTGMEEMELSQFVIRGQSNVYCLIPGYRFTLTRHPNADGTYVAGSVTHSAVEGDFHSGGETVESHYENTFTCFPVALRYHPARTTVKAHVWGCQTAVVVGPSGEEIYTDDKARVKVQFHWDREGKNDASSSCWIRVASHWAGQGWGAIHIPRIGQEVLVDFLEGDPDCPIIVGSVYNAVETPPYTLPDNKTQSGIRSRSSKGGGADNYNEIRLEDKKGSEQILIHAEKDLVTEVEHDETRTVQHDRTTNIQNDETVTIQGQRKHYVVGQEQLQTDGDLHLTASQNQNEKVGMTYSRQVGVNIYDKAGMNYGMEAGTAVHLKAGMTTVIEAGMGLTIKSAGGSIDINPVGVFIQGNMVFINTGAANVAGCGSSPTSPTSPGQTVLALAHAAGAAAAMASNMGQQVAQQVNASAAMAGNMVASVGKQALGAVSSAAQQALSAAARMGQMAEGAGAQILSQIDGAVGQGQKMLSDAVNQGQQMLNAGVNAVRTSVQQAIQQASGEIAQLENQAAQQLQGIAGQAAEQLQAVANQAQQVAQQATQAGQQALNQATQQLSQAAQQAAAQAQKAAQQAVGQAQQAAQQAAAQAQQAAQKAFQQAQQMEQQTQQQLQQATQGAQQQVTQAANQAQQQVQQATQQATQAAQQAGKMGQQAAQQVQQQVGQAAQQATQTVSNTASAAYGQVGNSASQASQGLQNSMKGMGL